MKQFSLIVCLCLMHLGFSQDVFEASRNGNVERLEELVELNSDTINSLNEYGFSPLIIACYRNRIETVRFLIKHGANLESSSQEGTAILGACYKGQTEIVKELLTAGANPDVSNGDGTTPLMFAVQSGNVSLVRLLLKHGSDEKVKDKRGLSAFDYAKKLGNETVLKELSE